MTLPEAQVEIARAIATIAHKGQTDKAGQPYIGHPRRVVAIFRQQVQSYYGIAAAWLHDVVEDTLLTYEDLKDAGVDPKVIVMVSYLTREPGQTLDSYYGNLRSAPAEVRAIKRADIMDNTSPARLALLDDATILRLTRKYAKALESLDLPPLPDAVQNGGLS